MPLPPTFRHDVDHWTTTTGTYTVRSTPRPYVDKHVLAFADSLEVSVRVADGVDTAGVDIDDAIRRYKEAHVISDRAFADPGKDWSAEIHEYFSPDEAVDELAALARMHRKHLRLVGHSRFNDQIVSASPHTVVIKGCVDSMGQQIKNDGDLPIFPARGSYYLHSAVMTRTDGQWYVSGASADAQKHCQGHHP